MARNNRRIPTASHFTEHLIMATQILRVPRSVEGCVVECGSYKGGSAANLSLICDLCDRKLEICDSFAGLPEPSISDKSHVLVNFQEIHTYEKGAFRGPLDEVKANISKHGKISACNFNVGYFDQTLPHFSQNLAGSKATWDIGLKIRRRMSLRWPRNIRTAERLEIATNQPSGAQLSRALIQNSFKKQASAAKSCTDF
jgi:O-methyltransferase